MIEITPTPDMSVDLVPSGNSFLTEKSNTHYSRELIEDGPVEPLQCFRVFQQLDHALEQTTSAAAVDASMIEA